MQRSDIALHRLIRQQLAFTKLKTPQEVVRYLLAMQSQEFLMAKWAIGLRLENADEAEVQKAYDEGKILRTHMMRPTWHFVAPQDIRWMQEITSHRVRAVSASMYRKLGLEKTFRKSNDVLAKALEGGNFLTRQELKAILVRNKISIPTGQHLAYLMMRAELDAVICSGPLRGKQFTYALLDERAPQARSLPKEEALATITQRYFSTRGPATIQDFCWWSGLTNKEAKEGLAALPKKFRRETIGGKEYIFDPALPEIKNKKMQTSFLMPDYDEYGIAYKDRSALASKKKTGRFTSFSHFIVIDGLIEGTWERMLVNKKLHVKITPFTSFNKAEQQKANEAVKRYLDFFSA